jgi:hypothetical protein
MPQTTCAIMIAVLATTTTFFAIMLIVILSSKDFNRNNCICIENFLKSKKRYRKKKVTNL